MGDRYFFDVKWLDLELPFELRDHDPWYGSAHDVSMYYHLMCLNEPVCSFNFDGLFDIRPDIDERIRMGLRKIIGADDGLDELTKSVRKFVDCLIEMPEIFEDVFDTTKSLDVSYFVTKRMSEARAEEDCVDNFRWARKGVEAEEREYKRLFRGGCCCDHDWEEVDETGQVWLFGYNFGH